MFSYYCSNFKKSRIFTERTDAKAEAPILWPLILKPPDVKSCLTGKDPNAGKDWRQKQKRAAEDEMVRQHHRINGHELSKLWEIVENKEAWHAIVHGITKSQQLDNITKKNAETNMQTKTLNSSTKETALCSVIEMVPLN